MKPSILRVRICALTLMTLLGALRAGAGTLSFVRVDLSAVEGQCFGAFCSNFVTDSDTLTDPGGQRVSVSGFAQKGPSTATADAVAELGSNRVQIFATYPSLINGDADGSAQSFWRDSFFIDVPGHTGEIAIFHGAAIVHGFVDAVGSAQSSVVVQAQMNGGEIGRFQVVMDPTGVTGSLPGGIAMFDFQQPFVLGTPFDFSVYLISSVHRFQTTFNGPDTSAGSGDVQFGNTVTWNGITEITLGGAPVNNYTFNSGSGLDYRGSFAVASAPEPGAFLTVFAALALFARRVRHLRN